ncbi:hypothetical protein DFP78_104338 [Photobacterium lutimaris]|nr:hypothetical protein DFP78_104338 [Photobacterium lutimaris]
MTKQADNIGKNIILTLSFYEIPRIAAHCSVVDW